MTRQINGKFIIIWWDQWELTHWNSLLAPSLKNLFGTLSISVFANFSCGVAVLGTSSHVLLYKGSSCNAGKIMLLAAKEVSGGLIVQMMMMLAW